MRAAGSRSRVLEGGAWLRTCRRVLGVGAATVGLTLATLALCALGALAAPGTRATMAHAEVGAHIDADPGAHGRRLGTCSDNIQNDGEADVDCGRSCAADQVKPARSALCLDDQKCVRHYDCASFKCRNSKCEPYACSHCSGGSAGVCRHDDPTNLSCFDYWLPAMGFFCFTGTHICAPAWDGEPCKFDEDCLSGKCISGICTDSKCDDGRQNGDESDVDCGGWTPTPNCPRCLVGKTCFENNDCASDICSGGVCASSCGTGFKDGDETDVDCGGSCPGCGPDKTCINDGDCKAGLGCIAGRCRDNTAPEFLTGFPKTGTVDGVSAKLEAQLNEAGKIFWVCNALPAVAPTAANVFAGKGPADATPLAAGSFSVTEAAKTGSGTATGLTPESGYKCWLVAEDDEPAPANRQTSAVAIEFQTADVTPPNFDTGFPRVASITGSSATLTVQLDEGSKAFWVLLPKGSATPSSVEVLTLVGPSGVTPLASGSIDAPTAGKAESAALLGLDDATDYDLWVAAQDDAPAPGPNKQAAAVKVPFRTADITPPAFLANTPAVTGVTGSTANVEVQLNEPGKFRWVVLPAASAAPSVSEVRGGAGPGGSTPIAGGTTAVPTAATKVTLPLTALASETALVVYVVAEDVATPTPNVQSAVTARPFTTKDVSPPTFMSGFPRTASISATTARLEARINEPGTFYYVVLPANDPAPNAAEVFAGTGAAGGSAPIKAGFETLGAGSPVVAASLSGMTAETFYDVWVIAQDDESPTPNKQAKPTRIHLATMDVAAPDFVTDYPKVSDRGGTWLAIDVQINEPGECYAIAVPNGDQPPLAADVRALKGFGGEAPSGSASKVVSAAAPATTTMTISGLQGETTYDLYVVCTDDAEPARNSQTQPASLVGTTLDTTPPAFLSGYPARANVAGDAFDAVVQLNEAGTCYIVVVPSGAPKPTSQNVKLGTAAGGVAAVVAGSVAVTAAGASATHSFLTGVQPQTAYDAYFACEDKATPTPNMQPSATALPVQTLDITPPKFGSGYPVADDVEGSKFKVAILLDEAGACHVVVVSAGVAPPSVADLLALKGSGGTEPIWAQLVAVPSASAAVEASVEAGLAPSTKYDVYLLCKDDEPAPGPNVQLSATRLDVETAVDGTPPSFPVPYPAVRGVTTIKATLDVQMDKAGHVYYIVVADRSSPPTSEQVKAGVTFGSTTVVASGNGPAKADEVVSFAVAGLTPEKHYDVHIAAEGDQSPPRMQITPTRVGFKTIRDLAPPNFHAFYPAVRNIMDVQADLQVLLDEGGTAWWCVDLAAKPRPTVDELRAGKRFGGASFVDSNSMVVPSPDVAVTATMKHLRPRTTYSAWVLVADARDPANVAVHPVEVRFTTREDLHPPSYGSGYPKVIDVSDRAASLQAALSESGAIYYVVVPAGATAPSSAQVRAAKSPFGDVIAVGHMQLPDANVAAKSRFWHLVPQSQYDLYAAAEDAVDIPNLQAAPTKVSFVTLPDTFPPLWPADYPKMVDLTHDSATCHLLTDEPSWVYWLLVLDTAGAAVPKNADIVAGWPDAAMAAGGSGAVVVLNGTTDLPMESTHHDTPVPLRLSPLLASTKYVLYMLGRDRVPHTAGGPYTQATATKLRFTTGADTVAPKFDYGPDGPGGAGHPRVVDVTTSSGVLEVVVDEAADVFYIVIPHEHMNHPLRQDVLDGWPSFGGGTGPTLSGSFMVAKANTVTRVPLSPVTAVTTYVVYLVARDTSPAKNTQELPTAVKFTTLGPAWCRNGFRDANETDVDCGNTCPFKCGNGKACVGADDCTSGVCQESAPGWNPLQPSPPTCVEGGCTRAYTGAPLQCTCPAAIDCHGRQVVTGVVELKPMTLEAFKGASRRCAFRLALAKTASVSVTQVGIVDPVLVGDAAAPSVLVRYVIAILPNTGADSATLRATVVQAQSDGTLMRSLSQFNVTVNIDITGFTGGQSAGQAASGQINLGLSGSGGVSLFTLLWVLIPLALLALCCCLGCCWYWGLLAVCCGRCCACCKRDGHHVYQETINPRRYEAGFGDASGGGDGGGGGGGGGGAAGKAGSSLSDSLHSEDIDVVLDSGSDDDDDAPVKGQSRHALLTRPAGKGKVIPR